jgi:hypothetical protein
MALDVSVRHLFKASGSNVAKWSSAIEPREWCPYSRVPCKICLKGRMGSVYKIHNVAAHVLWNTRYVYAQTVQLKEQTVQRTPITRSYVDAQLHSYRWSRRLCSSYILPCARCITRINAAGPLRTLMCINGCIVTNDGPRPAAVCSAVKKKQTSVHTFRNQILRKIYSCKLSLQMS